MPRHVPTAALLLLSVAAQAQEVPAPAAVTPSVTPQQPDSLALRRPAFLTIQSALSQTPGVQATPYSGAPGDWWALYVRGAATLTGLSTPLYVVDGVPVFQHDTPPEIGSFLPFSQPRPLEAQSPALNPLLSLPVADVESVEVLKGPVALARYGQQGRNGVVLIRTRRGAVRPDGPQVQYQGQVGLQQLRRRIDVLDAREFAAVANEARANSGQPPAYSAAELASFGKGTDWQQELYRPAVLHEHHASLQGGSERTRYYVAANTLQQAGILRNSNLQRYSLRANVDQQLGARLTLHGLLAGSQTQARLPAQEANLVQLALLTEPTIPVRDAQGNYVPRNLGFFGSAPNPAYLQEQVYREPRTRRLLAQLGADYQLSPALTLTARLSTDRQNVRQDIYGQGVLPAQASQATGGVTQTDEQRGSTTVAELSAHYQRQWAERHQLSASVTGLYQRYHQNLSSVFDNTAPPYNGGSRGTASDETRSSLVSPWTTATYSYDGRYEVQAALRLDQARGTKALPWQVSPGVQVSWTGSREAFMPQLAALDEWKLWAGVSRVGGQLSYIELVALPGPITGPLSVRNSYERDFNTEVGLRTEWLGRRLHLALTAYRRRTTGLLASYFTPNSYAVEAGGRNQGLELLTSARWQLGRLSGLSTLAASVNQNRLLDLPAGYNSATALSTLAPGGSFSSFWGTENDGIYPVGSPNAGYIRRRDQDGNGRIDQNDRVRLGSGLPKQLLSFTQTLQLNRWQLETQLNGQFGYGLYNPVLGQLDMANDVNNSSVRVRDRWTRSNQDTRLPAAQQLGQSGAGPTGDMVFTDASHLRLSQVTVRYALLRQPGRQFDVWVGGQNLLVISPYRGYDPNVSTGGAKPTYAGADLGAYPVPRTWLLGVQASF